MTIERTLRRMASFFVLSTTEIEDAAMRRDESNHLTYQAVH